MMTLGVDRLLADPDRWLRGRRIGLLANEASLTSGHRSTFEALAGAVGPRLEVLLTPEHGFSASEDDATAVPDGRDKASGLRVHSLYGPRRWPDAELLRSIDAVVVDLREVGVRCYTYATSVALLLEAARATDTEVVLCDRPSLLRPIVDGPPLEPSARSFLGYLDVPFMHGLTIGELMRLHARKLGGAPLLVVSLAGWQRGQREEGAFVPPSPGLPSPEAVLLYPALVGLEGTGLSEGRGTPLPFQLVGGPTVDGPALAAGINAARPAGVWARSISFRPESGKLSGRDCNGVQLHVADAAALRPVALGAVVLREVYRQGCVSWTPASAMHWAGGNREHAPWLEPEEGLLVDALFGDSSLREVAEGRLTFADVEAVWGLEHARYLDDVSDGVLLYGDPPRAVTRGALTSSTGTADPGAPETARLADLTSKVASGRPVALGIDAGGSGIRWLLANANGTVARGEFPPLAGHLFDQLERAAADQRLDELATAIAGALKAPARGNSALAPLGGSLAAVVAGVAGLAASGPEAAWLRCELAARLGVAASQVVVDDDIESVFQSTFSDGAGVLVYAGTGAIAVTSAPGNRAERLRAGGHGFLLDDEGGGFSIGRAALRAVLRETDQRGAAPETTLARYLYDATGGRDWDRVRAYVYGGGRSAVAALTPLVAAAATEGDPTALAVLNWAGRQLARLARLLLERAGEPRPVALTGGVARIGGELEAAFRQSVSAATEVRVVTEEPVVASARLALDLAMGKRS